MKNISEKTVNDFGEEWSAYTQEDLSEAELKKLFRQYFSILNWQELPKNPTGFDMGCGSGRWAKFVAERVSILYCIDASDKALDIAKRNLKNYTNCTFYKAGFDAIPLENNSMDFGYSLGVVHHIPDTFSGIKNCVKKLKPGAPFLAYIYYSFDNKPIWFRLIWKTSDLFRRGISRLPFRLKNSITKTIAGVIYYPLAKFSLALEKAGFTVNNVPLSFYRNSSFYTMQTDVLDRFGTRLEKRFSKNEIYEMFKKAGLEKIIFREKEPYWCVVGYKK